MNGQRKEYIMIEFKNLQSLIKDEHDGEMPVGEDGRIYISKDSRKDTIDIEIYKGDDELIEMLSYRRNELRNENDLHRLLNSIYSVYERDRRTDTLSAA